MQKKAIVLFSGGLDSTTCLAIAKAEGFECYALSFSYGQKHHAEIEHAKSLASKMGVIEHKILQLPIGELGGSSLTDQSMLVSDYQASTGVPNTYVPARNTIFLSFALAWGEVRGVYDIYFGANHVDYSNYPDCRPAYLEAFEKLAMLATKAGIEQAPKFTIHVPLLHKNKAEIIQEGTRLNVNYAQTISCYRADADGRACGKCDSCHYRQKGFAEANLPDPTIYY